MPTIGSRAGANVSDETKVVEKGLVEEIVLV
jgi:hypothetical protein